MASRLWTQLKEQDKKNAEPVSKTLFHQGPQKENGQLKQNTR